MNEDIKHDFEVREVDEETRKFSGVAVPFNQEISVVVSQRDLREVLLMVLKMLNCFGTIKHLSAKSLVVKKRMKVSLLTL
mgnify:CR=1 FL=1